MLFGIPFAIIGSVFGAITGFFTKRLAMLAELQASERQAQLQAMVEVSKVNSVAIDDEIKLLQAQAEYEKALAQADPHRSEARRYLAYAFAISLLFLLPAMVIYGDWQWFEIHSYTTTGFFGIGAKEVFETITAVGLPLAWLDGVFALVSTIVGFYFGTSSAKFTNPYIKQRK